MTAESSSVLDAFHLLKQLENILDHDPLINEIGFLHASQLSALNEEGDSLANPYVKDMHSVDIVPNTNLPDNESEQYDDTLFWSRDHKLAISMVVLPLLYESAKNAYMEATRQYNMLINLSENVDPSVDETRESSDPGNFRNGVLNLNLLEKEIMRHSKALLILSCDFGSAWNSRKQVVLRKQSFSFFLVELQLAALILSYSPKSEHPWAHRRWVIKMISRSPQNLLQLQEILKKESELVEQIAEKSKMNYRAWHHRCWLVFYMERGQVLEELKQSRKWAELHVADNCCFHYRNRLMLAMLEDINHRKLEMDSCFDDKSTLYLLWKDELDWNQTLIKRYIGREALWLHRRFLSPSWVKYCSTMRSENSSEINQELDVFLDNELMLLRSCSNMLDDNFGDAQTQAKYAASYILWISKHLPPYEGNRLMEKLRVAEDLKDMLSRICPEKAALWEGLMGGCADTIS